MNFRPMNDWVLVEIQPRPKKESIIIEVADTERLLVGVVKSTGPGRKTKEGGTIPMEVFEGDKVVFFRENLEHKNGKQILHSLEVFGPNIALIRSNDILYVIEA